MSKRQLQYIWNRISPVFSDMWLDGIEETKDEYLRRLNIILEDVKKIK